MGWWGDLKDWAGEQFDPTNPANNAYANVDQGNFNMPGFGARDAYTSQQMRGAQGRGAFSSDNNSTFRGDQMGLMQQMQGQYDNDASSYALARAGQEQANARAQQRSLMASASPSNSAMMARVGSQNIGRSDMGIAGQGMMARLAEKQGLLGQMSGLSTSARGQDLQNNQFNAGMQQGNRNANDAYEQGMLGANMQNAGMQQSGMMNYEANRLGRFNTIAGQPTDAERVVKGIEGGVQVIGGLASAFSDKKAKTNVQNAPSEADSFMKSIDDKTWQWTQEGVAKMGKAYQPMAMEYGRDVGRTDGSTPAPTQAPPQPNPYKRTYKGRDGQTYEVTLGQAQIEEGPPAPVQNQGSPQFQQMSEPPIIRTTADEPGAYIPAGRGRTMQTDSGRPRHLGVMAQSVEKTPMGAAAVKTEPYSGLKMIDGGAITGPVLASLARLNERLSKVEKK